MVVDSQRLRADARRNLERILESACVVFADRGLDASVSDVAERAGVGTATIFRRFPTKDDLVAAILERELETIRDHAVAAAMSDDPTAALKEFITWAVETFIDDRCLCEAAGGELFARPRIQELFVGLTGAVEQLLSRAQAAGSIRGDIVASDIGFLVNAIGHAGMALEGSAPGAWKRYVGLILDGLRSEGATPLEHDPPTIRQLHESKAKAVRRVSSRS
jgi:AcrR family transcriptional regulator